MKKFLIVLLVLVLILVSLLYAGKGIILHKIKTVLINAVESSTGMGVKIEALGYTPFKGVGLKNVIFFKDKNYGQEIFHLSSVHLKFPIISVLTGKTFSVNLRLKDLLLKNASVNGTLAFSLKLGKKISGAESTLESLRSIRLTNLSIKGPLLELSGINGLATFSPKLIKCSNMSFSLNGRPCALNFNIVEPFGKLNGVFTVSSDKFRFDFEAKKEAEIYKFNKIKGSLLNSSLDFTGELGSGKNPILSLYGKSTIDLKDISYLASPFLKNTLEKLYPSGTLESSIYFKGNVKNVSSWEMGIKSNATDVKLWEFVLGGLQLDARLNDSLLYIPLLNAYPYGGTFVSSAKIDLSGNGLPYAFTSKLSNVNLNYFFADTPMAKHNIKGLLSAEFTLQGKAKDPGTMEGQGKITISEANLGPMPLLSPMIGIIYGYLQNKVSGLKKINITNGSADFYIKNKKIITENLAIWGDIASIHAKGYVGFDKTLDFEVENQINESEPSEEMADWQVGLQAILVNMGKFLAKAHLTGTLDKPKWKYQYLEGAKNTLGGSIGEALKGIFE